MVRFGELDYIRQKRTNWRGLPRGGLGRGEGGARTRSYSSHNARGNTIGQNMRFGQHQEDKDQLERVSQRDPRQGGGAS